MAAIAVSLARASAIDRLESVAAQPIANARHAAIDTLRYLRQGGAFVGEHFQLITAEGAAPRIFSGSACRESVLLGPVPDCRGVLADLLANRLQRHSLRQATF
jgi:hypothetical protein